MTRVILFELGGGSYALKLEAVERILAPGQTAPSGCRVVDLARLFGVPKQPEPHLAMLAGSRRALAIGRPLGAAGIEAAWILPLPGYMFRGDRPPFRGLIEVPPERKSGPIALLLDEERLSEMPG